MTAYEELKAWCEKHLDKTNWQETFLDYDFIEDKQNVEKKAIQIKDDYNSVFIVFEENGSFCWIEPN